MLSMVKLFLLHDLDKYCSLLFLRREYAMENVTATTTFLLLKVLVSENYALKLRINQWVACIYDDWSSKGNIF